MPLAAEQTLRASGQGKYVPGNDDVRRAGIRVEGALNGRGAIGSLNAGFNPLARVKGQAEARGRPIGIVRLDQPHAEPR